ncbi:putative ABC transporter integral membrane protein [Streptomyces sp. Tu6071]|nr:putative ABC transporter integral membrane protein [Streptomyces sp. Tu6071]
MYCAGGGVVRDGAGSTRWGVGVGRPGSSGSGVACVAALDEDGDDDDGALGDLLDVRLEVVEREDVVDRGEDQHAEHGADDRAAPAAEQGAADDRGGDRVEFVQVAVGALARAHQDDEQEGRDAAAQSGEQVQVEALAADVDPGEAGRLGVGADRDAAPPEGGAVQQEPADDHDGEEDDDERRDAEHVVLAAPEVEHGLHGDDLRLAVGDLEREPACRGEHRERRDERDEPPVRDEDPVDEPAGEPDEERGEQDAPESVLLRRDGRRPHRGEGDDRADREVDAAGDDDEGDTDHDDPDDRGLGQDQLEVRGRDELVRLGDRADEGERREDTDEGERAPVPADQALGGDGLRGRLRGRLGRCGGGSRSVFARG